TRCLFVFTHSASPCRSAAYGLVADRLIAPNLRRLLFLADVGCKLLDGRERSPRRVPDARFARGDLRRARLILVPDKISRARGFLRGDKHQASVLVPARVELATLVAVPGSPRSGLTQVSTRPGQDHNCPPRDRQRSGHRSLARCAGGGGWAPVRRLGSGGVTNRRA